MSEAPIVAIALLTQDDLDRLGDNLTRVWPVDDVPRFDDLLRAIDRADQPTQPKTPTG